MRYGIRKMLCGIVNGLVNLNNRGLTYNEDPADYIRMQHRKAMTEHLSECRLEPKVEKIDVKVGVEFLRRVGIDLNELDLPHINRVLETVRGGQDDAVAWFVDLKAETTSRLLDENRVVKVTGTYLFMLPTWRKVDGTWIPSPMFHRDINKTFTFRNEYARRNHGNS